MEELGPLWTDAEFRRSALATAALATSLLVARIVLLRTVRSFTPSAQDAVRLKWSAYVRRTFWITLVLGIGILWATEIQSFIDEINWAYPPADLTVADVSMVNSGLVLFGDNETGSRHLSYGKRSRVVDHAKIQPPITRGRMRRGSAKENCYGTIPRALRP